MGKQADDKAYYERNKERIKARNAARYRANREELLQQQKLRYAETRDAVLARNKAWAAANPDKMRAYHSAYVKRNRALWTAQTAAYRAARKQATPAWGQRADVLVVYRAARRLTEVTGAAHHVDHIVPLQSALVCGLHVVWNLQILPGRANRVKSNKHWPDMP